MHRKKLEMNPLLRIRKHLLEYDDVANRQRKVIYSLQMIY